MTGTQILAKFENYISDQLDQDFEIQLAGDTPGLAHTINPNLN